jgi:NADPH-dependent ferric siderophore reductase
MHDQLGLFETAGHDGRVTETIPSPGSGGDMTTEAFLSRAPEVSLLRLTVVEATDTGTATRLIRVTGDDLAGFAYAAGQDLMILVDTSGGRIIRRRYTIRRFDPADLVLDLHIVTDSGGPGARWTRDLRVGDVFEAIGPRGKITFKSDVTSHFFVGDDVSAPAIAAMVEALPAGSRATVIVEVTDPIDATKIDPAYEIDLQWTWLYRGEAPDGDPALLLAAVDRADLPVEAHAYVFGEASAVTAIGGRLQARGLVKEQISAKAYWGRGRANASHGEPLKG